MNALAITVRSHRFELLGVGVFASLALGIAGFVVARLTFADVPPECFYGSQAACLTISARVEAYFSLARDWGLVALGLITLLPILSGLILGIALAGKEIDRGTSVFAWSLSPSRRRWLAGRALPIGAAVVIASLAGGLLADRLQALRDPGVDPAGTFEHLGIRGLPVAAEALAAFGIGLACGALSGRILPSLLIAGFLIGATIAAVNVGTYALLDHETVYVPGVDGGPSGPVRWRVVDYLVLAPPGEVITWQEAYERYGDPGAALGVDNTPQLATVLSVNPGEMYPLVAARMALLYSVIGLAGCVVAFAAVDRRRP
jgi:hypothetical protein